MSKSEQSPRGGIGFVGLLTILFIGLKLCGVIAWSWLWVLSPMWISLLLVLAILVFIGFCALMHELTKGTGG
jgi:hypothetical protein